MDSISVGEFKADFSNIISQVQDSGKKYIIEYGRKHKRVAMIVPYDEQEGVEQEREFGLLKEKASFVMHDDFVMSDEEFLDS